MSPSAIIFVIMGAVGVFGLGASAALLVRRANWQEPLIVWSGFLLLLSALTLLGSAALLASLA